MPWNCKSKQKQIHKGFRPIVSEPGRKLNAAWCFSKSRIFSAYQLFPRDPFSEFFFSKMRSGKHSHRKPAATKLSNDQLRRHFSSWSNLEKWRQIYKQFIFTYLLTYLLMDDFLICVLNLQFINHILSMITRIWSRDSSSCPGSEFESEKVTSFLAFLHCVLLGVLYSVLPLVLLDVLPSVIYGVLLGLFYV